MKRNIPNENNVGPNPNALYENQSNFTPPTTGTKKIKDHHNQHAQEDKASPTSSNITSSDGKRKSVF